MSIDYDKASPVEQSGRMLCPFVATEEQLRSDELSLAQIFSILWDGKRVVIIVTLAATLLAVFYLFFAPPVFSIQSQVLVRQKYGERALAVVQSVNFLEDVVAKENLLPWIFKDKWDDKSGSWVVTDADIPSIRLGGLYLQRHMKVKRNGRFARISLKTVDPSKGVAVVRAIIVRANALLVDQVVKQARSEIRSLQNTLAEYDSLLVSSLVPDMESMISANSAVSRESLIDDIVTSLETKLVNSRSYENRGSFMVEIQQNQTLISEAQSHSDGFALTIVEEAAVPERKEKIWPKGIVLIPAGFLGGLFISIAFVLGRGVTGRILKVPE